MTAVTLLFSFLFDILLSFYKERKSLILFEKDDIKKIMPFKFLDTILKFNKG